MTNEANILVINAGSSSIKFALFAIGLNERLHGIMEGIGTHPRLQAFDAGGEVIVDRTWPSGSDTSIHHLLEGLTNWLEEHVGRGRLTAIGHRVATGGLQHSAPAIVSRGLIEMLRDLVPLAPLHQPRNLEPIEAFRKLHPSVPQVVCFDTAFHRTLPRTSQLYGLPRQLSDAGAQRIGYHGLSYEYIASQLPALDAKAAEGRTVVAHLGSGASMCALHMGKSIETTMGFSPLSGLVMSTRPGDLDPGLLIWLIREKGMSVDAIEQMLYRESGLKGISEISGDLRDLLASTDAQAREAIDVFVHRILFNLGGHCAALGGLDALVFTGGIGENAAEIREAVCKRASWLGIELDSAVPPEKAGPHRISTATSQVAVWVIPTNEELMIARHTARLLLGAKSGAHGNA